MTKRLDVDGRLYASRPMRQQARDLAEEDRRLSLGSSWPAQTKTEPSLLPALTRSLFLVAVLLVAACSDSQSSDTNGPATSGFGPGLSISEAMKTDAKGPLLVNGWLLATSANDVRLCESLTPPEPPRCGQPSLAVRGLDLAKVENLKRDSGSAWSQQPVRLLGTLKNGVLTVSDTTRG